MIQPGEYTMKLVSAELQKTKEGKPYINATFEAVGGEYAGEKAAWFGHFSDKTGHQTFRSLELLGFTGDDVSDLTSAIGGQTTCTIEMDAGMPGSGKEPRPRVRYVGPREIKKLDENEAKALASSVKHFKANGGKPAPVGGALF